MNILKLRALQEQNKVIVFDSCVGLMIDPVHVWEVIRCQNIEEYVVFSDNTVITRRKDGYGNYT